VEGISLMLFFWKYGQLTETHYMSIYFWCYTLVKTTTGIEKRMFELPAHHKNITIRRILSVKEDLKSGDRMD
jgi:hypothetical protein